MLSLGQVKQIHARFWRPNFGSISPSEAYFLQEGIVAHKPKRFMEIGTASGLSTGLIATFMHDAEKSELTTIDLATKFWADNTKQTGYLAEQIYSGGRVAINFIRGKNSLFIDQRLNRKKYDMAFVDANHQHPWPTLDMVVLLPAMESKSLIYHHDLALYKLKDYGHGIGPKYLYDQIPDDLKKVMSDERRNIFYVETPDSYDVLEDALIDSLYLPWSNIRKIDEPTIRSYGEIAGKYWSPRLQNAIVDAACRMARS